MTMSVDNVVAADRLWLGHAAAGTAKPLVSEGLPHLIATTRGFFMLFYRAALPLSSRTLNFAAAVVRWHLKAIGSRWRKLSPGQEALIAFRLVTGALACPLIRRSSAMTVLD